MTFKKTLIMGLLGCTILAGCNGSDDNGGGTSQSTFDALNAQISQLQADLDKEKQAHQDADARALAYQATLAGLEQRLAQAQADLDAAGQTGEISAERQRTIDALNIKIRQLETEIEGFKKQAGLDQASDTTALTAATTASDEAIAKLNLRIAELEAEIEALRPRVDIALTQFVDPFIGTGAGQKFDGPNTGNGMGAFDFPAAGRPFGMVNWGPDTTTPTNEGWIIEGYHHSSNKITGFTLTHLSGVGCTSASAIPFLPMAETSQTQPTFDHANETAGPGYYHVKFSGSNIETDLTATLRTGIGKFTYPSGSKALVKVTAKTSSSSGSINVDRAARTVSGSASDANFCGAASRSFQVYFFAKFDQPFTEATSGAATTLTFTAAPGVATVVGVKIGVSLTSVENAKDNLEKESAALTFDEAKKQADADWNKRLNAVQVTGGQR